jgi:putative phosphotransacetylase
MKPQELDALAARIAALLSRRGWVPAPVRPDPPGPPVPGHLPPWAAAAQALPDIAPVTGRKTGTGRHRPAYDAVVTASRAAAAGRGPSPLPGGAAAPPHAVGGGRTVPVAVSNRHIHVTQGDFERLFGAGKQLTPDRPIAQPGQFAAVERVRVVGPSGVVEAVRLVGPARAASQVELSLADCRAIGLTAPVRHSGRTAGSAPVRLEGPQGSVELAEGAIVAARHLHVSPADAGGLGVADGDRVTLVLGPVERRVTLPDVLVRSGAAHATELHVDTDEANAFGITSGDLAMIVGRPRRGHAATARARPGRALLTERDVDQIAGRGEMLSDRGPYRLTPLARDRARALGVWRDET